MSKLKISDDLSLPIEAVTETIGFLGRRGSGKSYAAHKLAEEMHRCDAQFVAIDPVGIWYGLRLAADGKSPGLPIPVLGGLHGDIPLEATGGALIANLVVDRGASVVLDVSQFESDADKARFAQAFADRFFFRKKASPSAVHVFIEEAQEFVPQNPQREEARMLHAFTRMAKIGRNFGIGLSLISQRPQEVNKKVLNLTELLFAFQLTGPHERKTLQGWIADKGIDEDIEGILPKLERGAPHVWSPAWLKISRVIQIAKKNTFDASSTPKVGKEAAARNLSPIDLDQLRTDMAATIEKAKAEDPKLLRKRIAELERAAGKPQAVAAPDASKADMAAEYQRGLDEGFRSGQANGITIMRVKVEAVGAHLARAAKEFHGTQEEFGNLTTVIAQARAIAPQARRPPPATASPQAPRQAPTRRSNGSTAPSEGLTGPEQRILDALAWLESVGNNQPEQPAVAFLAGYTVGGGAFNNPKGRLRGNGLIEYVGGDRLALTDAGRKLANAPDGDLTAEELQSRVLERLPGPERKLLRVLIENYPKPLPYDELADRAGYASGGGAFNNPRGRLRSLGLVEYPSAGKVVALPVLFLE